MPTEGTFRRRHLPHWDVEDKPIFITACLAGSIPAAGLAKLRSYQTELDQRDKPPHFSMQEWKTHKHKLYFKLVDELIDHQSPVQHLNDERQAQILYDALFHFADERYSLYAFVIMPSHYHWLFQPKASWVEEAIAQASPKKPRTPRQVISHSIQSYTATVCNQVRGQTGAYWQDETYDHWVRDEEELFRIINYIELNPVAADLASTPEEFRWSSARIRAALGLNPGEVIPNALP